MRKDDEFRKEMGDKKFCHFVVINRRMGDNEPKPIMTENKTRREEEKNGTKLKVSA